MRRTLRPYQKVALRYVLKNDHAALFMEMRLGKTLVSIRAIKSMRSIDRVLIVGPYSVFGSWIDELTNEGEDKEGICILDGSTEERSKRFMTAWYDQNCKWFLMSKEAHQYIPKIALFRWDAVILDESTFIKGPPAVSRKTKKMNVSKYYTKYFREVKKRIILTGTPAPESPLNYYMQLQFLDPAILSCESYWKFRHKYFTRCGFKWIIKKRVKQDLIGRLGGNCFFLKRDEVSLGGEKIYEVRQVKLHKSAIKTYRTLEEEFLLEFGGEEIGATIYKTSQYIWLRRLCSGWAEDGKFKYNHKASELVNLLTSELSGQQVVVWCQFVEEIKALYPILTKNKLKVALIYGAVPQKERRQIQKDFQDGKYDLILGQPECYKYGTNLSAADTVIYFSTPPGGETRMQSEDRVVNTATQDSSLIIDLIVENSMEEDILKSLKAKETQEEQVRRIAQGIQRRRGYGVA